VRKSKPEACDFLSKVDAPGRRALSNRYRPWGAVRAIVSKMGNQAGTTLNSLSTVKAHCVVAACSSSVVRLCMAPRFSKSLVVLVKCGPGVQAGAFWAGAASIVVNQNVTDDQAAQLEGI